MSAVTLNQLQQYNVAHLTALAEYANKQGSIWDTHYTGLRARANGFDWTGYGDDMMRLRVLRDTTMALNSAGTATAIGTFAAFAATNLYAIHGAAMANVQAAKADMMSVDSDLTVTDASPIAALPERKAQVQAHQQAINAAVTTLHNYDQQVAAVIGGHQNTLESTRFADGTPIHSGVRPVDNRFKTGGGDNPFNDPPIPPIGGEPVGVAGQQTSLEKGLGGPPMPAGWPKHAVTAPPPKCGPGEFARKTADVAIADAGTTAAALALPMEGPAAVLSIAGVAVGLEQIGDKSDALIRCIEKGLGG